MRDFHDAKAMAQAIRSGLAARGLSITNSESLELIAKAFGLADWNALSAAIKTAQQEQKSFAGGAGSEPPLPPGGPLQADDRVQFSAALEKTLSRAVGLALERKHEYVAVEHVLLALNQSERRKMVFW